MAAEKELPINNTLSISRDELKFTFARSSGPGGQNVNKVNTKAVLRWRVCESPSMPEELRDRFLQRFRNRINAQGFLVLSSDRFRDQRRNVRDCEEKLRQLVLSIATPEIPRKRTRPPRRVAESRLRNKKAVSKKKELRRVPRQERDG